MINQTVWDTHYTRANARQLYPDENVVRVLKKQFSVRRGKALDLGAGSGRHLPPLAESFSTLHACDFSRTSLKLCAHDAIELAQAKLPELPYADASFDFVLCWGILHYLNRDEIKPAVAEIRRILKSDGKFFLTLRADSDTHLKRQLETGDLKDGHALLFSKSEALALFADFSQIEYGYIERMPLNESYKVAHHMILATTPST